MSSFEDDIKARADEGMANAIALTTLVGVDDIATAVGYLEELTPAQVRQAALSLSVIINGMARSITKGTNVGPETIIQTIGLGLQK